MLKMLKKSIKFNRNRNKHKTKINLKKKKNKRSKKQKGGNYKKIAFCFLIYDTIEHEDIWNIFFNNIDKRKYSVYIHYKYNKPLKYFDKYKLDNCIETKYGDISLVKAQNVMLRKALKDRDNKHFIFISNSCIPLKSFDHVYNSLNDNYSYFNIAPQSQCFPKCNYTLNFIEKKYIQKASQWSILNRKHAELMVNNNDYLKWFNSGTVPDEHCYITNIFVHKLQNEIITTPNLANGATTFTNWEFDMDYKYPSTSDLKTYYSISDEELLYLLNSKSLFGRKFNKDCRSSLNKKYIDFITKK